MSFKIRSRQCATCIYRPGQSWDIEKLERDVADPNMPGHFSGWRVCHHVGHMAEPLDYNPAEEAEMRGEPGGVCCAGFAARHGDRCTPIQIATRFGLIERVDGEGPER